MNKTNFRTCVRVWIKFEYYGSAALQLALFIFLIVLLNECVVVIIMLKVGERTAMKAAESIVFQWLKHPDTKVGNLDTLCWGHRWTSQVLILFYFWCQLVMKGCLQIPWVRIVRSRILHTTWTTLIQQKKRHWCDNIHHWIRDSMG